MGSPTLWYWLIPLLSSAVLALAFFGWRALLRRDFHAQLHYFQTLFDEQRSQLQASFFQAASASGKPRGLRWQQCEWEDVIEWVRDKKTGQLLALVGLTISFEAIEGGDMEGIVAVGNLRTASAVFFVQDGQWQTAGRAIFNLSPPEAVQHFQQGYERLSA